MIKNTKGKVCAGVANVPNVGTDSYRLHHCIAKPNSNHIVALTGLVDSGEPRFDATSEADAIRLAACWNAFEGIATEDIERCHVIGKPIEAGCWSKSEDFRKRWGALPLPGQWPSDSKNEHCEYKSAYKELYGAWIGCLVEQIRETVGARISKAKKEAKAEEFLCNSGLGLGASVVIDPVKKHSDNSERRHFVCPTVEEITDILTFHYDIGGKKSVAESLRKLIASKNGGAL